MFELIYKRNGNSLLFISMKKITHILPLDLEDVVDYYEIITYMSI